MKLVGYILYVVALAVFSTWLFANDNAAKPGPLTNPHENSANCDDCHLAWRGVEDKQCLNCHEFGDVILMRPAVRFHEAKQQCTQCHREHQGPTANISKMDHAMLNGALSCDICHLDPHDALFGGDCRACHSLEAFRVAGFRHPRQDDPDCHRCHALPRTHQDEHFELLILELHTQAMPEETTINPKECGRCHTIHDWRHRLM